MGSDDQTQTQLFLILGSDLFEWVFNVDGPLDEIVRKNEGFQRNTVQDSIDSALRLWANEIMLQPSVCNKILIPKDMQRTLKTPLQLKCLSKTN